MHYRSVTMNLSDREIEIVSYLRAAGQLEANTDAVGLALLIAEQVFRGIEDGDVHAIALMEKKPQEGLFLNSGCGDRI